MTSNELINQVLGFYARKIKEIEVKSRDSLDKSYQYLEITYYEGSQDDLSNKVTVVVFWNEKNGEVEFKGRIIYKMDVDINIRKFNNDELEFFDRKGFEIDETVTEENGQIIEDWWGAKL